MKRHASSLRSLRRIFIINPVGGLGGAERSMLDFVASAREAAPQLAFHVLLFVDGPLVAEVERLGATASVLPLPFRLHRLGDSELFASGRRYPALKLFWALLKAAPALILFLIALRAAIARWQPDVVHTNGMKAHLLSGFVVPSKTPLVWHMHDFLSLRPLAKRCLRLTANRASAVIAISESVANDTRRVLPHLRIVTLLNAVDTDAFSPGTPNGTLLDLLAGMAAPKDVPIRIGFIATYARWKGHDIFLKAAARVHLLLPTIPLRFYVIGGAIYATDGSQFSNSELKSLIDALGLHETAGLIPFQSELVTVLRSLDIFVHASSRPEPFGRSIVEAMACARSVVVASGGGVGEIVDSGETGLTHEPGDVAGLAEALLALILSKTLRQRLGAKARSVVVARFSRSRLGPALLAFYQSII